MGGTCPYTCCQGWNILIDDDTYENYKKEPGLLGKAIRLCSVGQQFTVKCHFHTKDGLCYFQKNNRMDLMPKVCQFFPRRVVDFGEYGEMTYYLSCYNVALDFVRDSESFELVEVNEEAEVNWPIGNYDPAFLEYLLENRRQILKALKGPEPWRVKLGDIYKRTYSQNMSLARQEYVLFNDVSNPKAPGITPKKGYLFFPVHILNDLILNHIMNSRTCKKGTYLYQVVKRYRDLTGGLTQQEADSFMETLVKELYEANKGLETLMVNYVSYMIVQDYCMAYEDYYIIEPVLTSIASAELFLVLCATENRALGKKDASILGDENLAALLSNLEKASRSSGAFDKKIIENFRGLF